jgi:hypothetical protein
MEGEKRGKDYRRYNKESKGKTQFTERKNSDGEKSFSKIFILIVIC